MALLQTKPFCLLFLIFMWMTTEGGSLHSRHRRSIGQFGDMIRRATQREALLYNEYGNHCGFQGGDQPVVDEVDRCCMTHDQCYETANREQCSSSWLGASFTRYSWQWDGQQLHCGEGSACEMAACTCDKLAAECFAQHPWNPEHKHFSIWDILA
ncbi:basic phospholipase A2 PA-12C-like [Penaeus japonicus]|uniref:basic phospholipase A2 PA-12C-like n=1 Tax=Penaeus japonicus TaxID=27405 RepID=UPI001C710B3B|nr:basic phospholipase A2 PA-12C-like [Penaeus japonicus]